MILNLIINIINILKGVVSFIEPILNKVDFVVNLARQLELYIFTYGDQNNVLQNIIKQNSAGVDGIITDR